jgi:hypothetical protein
MSPSEWSDVAPKSYLHALLQVLIHLMQVLMPLLAVAAAAAGTLQCLALSFGVVAVALSATAAAWFATVAWKGHRFLDRQQQHPVARAAAAHHPVG